MLYFYIGVISVLVQHETFFIAVCSCIFSKFVDIIILSNPPNPIEQEPNLIEQDFELIRVFDSLEFEDETEETAYMSLQSRGTLNEEQTRQLMQYLGSVLKAWGDFLAQTHVPTCPTQFLRQDSSNERMAELLRSNTRSLGLGVADAKAKAMPGTPGGPGEKQPKKVNHQRLVSSKIAAMSSKMTDCMAWTSKLAESTTLFLSWVPPNQPSFEILHVVF